MTQNTKTADQSLMYTIGRPSSNVLYNDRKDSLTNHSEIQNNVVVTNIIRTYVIISAWKVGPGSNTPTETLAIMNTLEKMTR